MPPPEGSLLLVVHTTHSETTQMCTTMGILSSTSSVECKIVHYCLHKVSQHKLYNCLWHDIIIIFSVLLSISIVM